MSGHILGGTGEEELCWSLINPHTPQNESCNIFPSLWQRFLSSAKTKFVKWDGQRRPWQISYFNHVAFCIRHRATLANTRKNHTAFLGKFKKRQVDVFVWQKYLDSSNWNKWSFPSTFKFLDFILAYMVNYDKGGKDIQGGKDSLFNKLCWENWTETCKNKAVSFSYTILKK